MSEPNRNDTDKLNADNKKSLSNKNQSESGSRSRTKSPLSSSSKTKKPMSKELILQCIDAKVPGSSESVDSSSDEDSDMEGWSEIKLESNLKETEPEASSSNKSAASTSKTVNFNEDESTKAPQSASKEKSEDSLKIILQGAHNLTEGSTSESDYYSDTGDSDNELNLETIENFSGGTIPHDDQMIQNIISVDPKSEPRQERKLIRKMVQGKPSYEKPTRSSTAKEKEKTDRHSHEPKTPPGRHRVKVYDKSAPLGPVPKPEKGKSEQKPSTASPQSPYTCDFIDIDGTLKLNHKHFSALITNAEYRLLQEFKPTGIELIPDPIPNPEKPKERAKVHHLKISPPPSAKSKVPVKVHKSHESFAQTEHPELIASETQTRRVEFNLDGNSVQSYTVVDDGNLGDEIDADNNKEDYYTSTASTELQSIIGETFMFPANIEDLNDENLLKQLADSSEKAMSKSIIISRAITSLIASGQGGLMMKNSGKPSAETLAEVDEICDNFKQSSSDPKESLQILLNVFGTAYHRIFSHLKIVNAYDQVSQKKFYEEDEETETVDQMKLVEEESPKYNFIPGLPNNQFRIHIRESSGHFLKTISFKNIDYTVKYRCSEHKSINSITSASREPYEPIPLSPTLLHNMQNRNISYIHARLTTSKFYVNSTIDEMVKIIQKILTGKYCKMMDSETKKISSHCRNKIKELNVFSGLVCQISSEFSSAVKKFRSGVLKTMQLDNTVARTSSDAEFDLDVISTPTFIGFEDSNSNSSKITLEGILPVREAMNEIKIGLGELSSILKMGQESMAHLNGKDGNVKVKSKHVKVLNTLLDSIRQLEFSRDVDFGAILMAIITDTITVQNLIQLEESSSGAAEGENEPKLDHRTQMLFNFVKLYRSLSELVKYSKKLSLLSSYVACKSMEGLRRFCITTNGRTWGVGNIQEIYERNMDKNGKIEVTKNEEISTKSKDNNESESEAAEDSEIKSENDQKSSSKKKSKKNLKDRDHDRIKQKLANISRHESNASSIF